MKLDKETVAWVIPLLQAAAEGKTIQRYFAGKWHDQEHLGFSDAKKFYRIKPPEPLVKYLVVDTRDGLSASVYTTSYAAQEFIDRYTGYDKAFLRVAKLVEERSDG